jgi:hypothetical protein
VGGGWVGGWVGGCLGKKVSLRTTSLRERLPVIGREHFRKTRTNFLKHLFGISKTNLQNGTTC